MLKIVHAWNNLITLGEPLGGRAIRVGPFCRLSRAYGQMPELEQDPRTSRTGALRPTDWIRLHGKKRFPPTSSVYPPCCTNAIHLFTLKLATTFGVAYLLTQNLYMNFLTLPACLSGCLGGWMNGGCMAALFFS